MRSADDYAAAARQNFLAGYNCAQSVLLAFAGDIGMKEEEALRLASPFGAGMGRLRQVCGALTAAFAVEGALRGYADPAAAEEKAALYARVQDLARAFEAEMEEALSTVVLNRGPHRRLLRRAPVPKMHRVRRAPCRRHRRRGEKNFGRNLKKPLAISAALW